MDDTPTIIATYTPPEHGSGYKVQVVEKPVVRLPKIWRDLSVVVMDGPFGCIDPLGVSGLHVMGHVCEAIHWVGERETDIPVHFMGELHKGIQHFDYSRFPEMQADLARYLPIVADAVWQGSYLTVRCVIDNPATDARPTLVSEEGDGVLRIFSGKMGTCVDAAEECLRRVEAM